MRATTLVDHLPGKVTMAAAVVATLASCSVFLNRETQCTRDEDCAGFSSTAVCSSGACLESAPTVKDAGLDSEPPSPPGCFTGTPSSDIEFYNRCTTSSFMTFDNCERLGLCDESYDPQALIDPPAGDPGTPPNTDVTLPSLGCYDAVQRPNVIFMQGSTNFTPFIKAMAPIVVQRGYTIVWQPTSSCAGAEAGGFAPSAAKRQMRNPTNTTQSFAAFYDAQGNATPCALGNSPQSPEPGVAELTEIGQSDVFAASCGDAAWIPGSQRFPSVGHYLGPIQAMVFVTPPASTQRVISAEAAHMVFGMGGNAGKTHPWIDPNYMWIRSSSTGTNNIISRGIDVPPSKWWGIDKKTAPAMHDAILTVSAAEAEKTIGTLSADYASRSDNSLHVLYFQARGQRAGFLPDSAPAARDKANVRDGHYPLWGPIHLYTPVTGGQPSAAAAAFILPFSTPNQTLIDATIAGGSVPVCAMHVARDTEMGALRSYRPGFQCHCYYEFKVTGGTNCQRCVGPAECPVERPACNVGYCEGR